MSETPEAELRQLAAAWDRAMIGNDPEAIGRFMADDWVIIGTDGSIGHKADFLDFVRSGALTHDVMESHELDVRVYGQFRGEAFRLSERVSSVFIRGRDQWKCVSTHLSNLPEGPA